MKKLTNLKDRFIARREEAQANENGFSLLELVVAIGILLVLTVGGLIGYSAITNNARTAAATSAASEISTEIMVKETQDGTVDVDSLVATYEADEETYKDLNISYDAGVLTVQHAKGGEAAKRTLDVTETP